MEIPPVISRSRKRVLFVGHSPLQGGAEICLDTTLRHLDRSRFEARAVFPWDGPMAQSVRDQRIPLDLVSLCWWSHWPRSAWYYKNLMVKALPNIHRLRRLILRHRIDLVYTNTACIFESAFAAAWAGVPHVWHVHEVLRSDVKSPGVLPVWLSKKLIERMSDRVIFESYSARGAFENGVPSSKAEVVHNSVRFAEPGAPEEAAEAKAKFGFTEKDIVVGFVGQFIERKNPKMLLHAMDRLKHEPNVKLAFIGDGLLREELTRMIAELGLGDRCRLLPFQSDVRWVMQGIDVLALTSDEESFGLVLVEAGAYGKPVVATRVEGPSEIVVDGETGYLVGKNDDVELADKLGVLCRNRELRRHMGNLGQQRVRQLFAPASNTRKIEELIDQAFRERHGSRRAVCSKDVEGFQK